MSKRPWFPLYVGDVLADTMNFDPAQFGGYMKILCHYWMTEEPMTMNEMRVASGLSKNIFQKTWPLLEKKFVVENEKYFNRRMRREIIKAVEISDKRAIAGRAGGQAIAQANEKQLPTQLQSQLHKEQKREQKSPHKKRASQLPHDWILPNDYREYCITKRPDLDPDATAENFRDYHLGHGKPMSDWKATWRNWVRKEYGTRKQKSDRTGNPTASPASKNREATADYFRGRIEGDGDIVAEND